MSKRVVTVPVTWERANRRNIPGFGGKYAVSPLGIVYNSRRANPLFLSENNCGYKVVTLYKEGKPRRYMVHRLVAVTFISNPQNKPYVNHKNGDRLFNAMSNLEWVTASENQLHSFRELGRTVWNKGNITLHARKCRECETEFRTRKVAQILCSVRCVGRHSARARGLI